MRRPLSVVPVAVVSSTLVLSCGSDDGESKGVASSYALASVVIDADGNRNTYVQTISELEGHVTNERAIEMPGNGVVMAGGGSLFVGLAEEPTWIRYSADGEGVIRESGRLSLLNQGAAAIDYGNAYVDETTAVSVLSAQAIAVIWNPTTLEITGEIDLGHLVQPGLDVEVWTTTAHDGLVYIPGRWANWDEGTIRPMVSLTIVDPKQRKVVAVAEDDRCASGGRIVFDKDGYGYVMGDGRNYSIQMFANAAGTSAPDNCILRISPGQTDFDADYFYTIPSLTGGLQSISELEGLDDGSGVAFAKMFYPDELPDGVEPIDFGFWSVPAHKEWRIELGDPPVAKEVGGAPFAAIGFGAVPFQGRLYSGESPDGNTSEVYEVDPVANTAVKRFTMDGYFYGLFDLSK